MSRRGNSIESFRKSQRIMLEACSGKRYGAASTYIYHKACRSRGKYQGHLISCLKQLLRGESPEPRYKTKKPRALENCRDLSFFVILGAT